MHLCMLAGSDGLGCTERLHTATPRCYPELFAMLNGIPSESFRPSRRRWRAPHHPRPPLRLRPPRWPSETTPPSPAASRQVLSSINTSIHPRCSPLLCPYRHPHGPHQPSPEILQLATVDQLSTTALYVPTRSAAPRFDLAALATSLAASAHAGPHRRRGRGVGRHQHTRCRYRARHQHGQSATTTPRGARRTRAPHVAPVPTSVAHNVGSRGRATRRATCASAMPAARRRPPSGGAIPLVRHSATRAASARRSSPPPMSVWSPLSRLALLCSCSQQQAVQRRPLSHPA